MTKNEFLEELEKRLCGLPKDEVTERIGFYSEIIDDRIEEGLSEEEAILQTGSVDEILSQIASEIPLSRMVKEKLKPKRRLKAWEITLVALASPIWLPLLISAFAVFFSLYASLWSVIVSIWAAFASLVGSALGGVLGGIILMLWNNAPSGLMLIGCALVSAGLSVFLFYGCKAATRGVILLTKKILLCIKKSFIKKEAVQ